MKTGSEINNINENNQNDLVYRDYDKGIELEKGTRITITSPELDITDDENAGIWLINLKTDETSKITDYAKNISALYQIKETGAYLVYALIEKNGSCQYVDLTEQCIKSVEYDLPNNYGIILLK